jgi:hypothetical protein
MSVVWFPLQNGVLAPELWIRIQVFDDQKVERKNTVIESGSTTLVSTPDFNEVATGVQKSNEMKHFQRYHKVRLKLF